MKKNVILIAVLLACSGVAHAEIESAVSGYGVTLTGGLGGEQGVGFIQPIDSDSLNSVTIDVGGNDVTFDVTLPSLKGDAYTLEGPSHEFEYSANVAQKKFLYSSRDLQYAKFGSWISRITNPDKIDAFFAQGNATLAADVPATGTASYSGAAVFGAADGAGGYAGRVVTPASFDVNFGAHQLIGTIGADGGILSNDLVFNAAINGNAFEAGSAAGDGFHTQGKFYGPNADELAGVFRDATYAGAYGAAKD